MPFDREPKTATVARDRLQIIIAQECAQKSQAPGCLPALRKELLGVLSRYANVSLDGVHIPQKKQDNLDALELNITLSEQKKA